MNSGVSYFAQVVATRLSPYSDNQAFTSANALRASEAAFWFPSLVNFRIFVL